jgi:hypothetical protein
MISKNSINFVLHLVKHASFSSCCNFKDNRNINCTDVKPTVKYANADVDKVKIFADNRNKVGVYRWVNNKNGNTYVGSSINLNVRLYTYFSLRSLAKSNRPCLAPDLFHSRYFSTSYPVCSPLIPVKHYSNADLVKIKILEENMGKSGIYL